MAITHLDDGETELHGMEEEVALFTSSESASDSILRLPTESICPNTLVLMLQRSSFRLFGDAMAGLAFSKRT
jgi:hypothetical protein